MDLLIDVLLLFFALVGSIAGIGGRTWNEDLEILPPDPRVTQSLLGRVTNKLREWKLRLEPRGWVALACVLAAFALGVTKEVRTNRRLHELKEQAIADSKKLSDMVSLLNNISHRLESEPPPIDPSSARAQQTFLENARRAVETTPVGPLLVISVAEPRYSDGRYFDFDSETVDKLLGRTDWDKHVFLVSKSRDRGFRRAVFWRGRDDAPGGARGRLLPTGKPGDWKKNETFYLMPKDYGPWDPKEQ